MYPISLEDPAKSPPLIEMKFAFDLFDHCFDHSFGAFDLRLKKKSNSIGSKMPARLPESTRSAVVQKWLEGQSRNKIAAQCNVSQGATSGIIDNWERSEGVGLAEQLRDLALTIERNRISVVQCAQGFRVSKIIKHLGIKEDEAEAFLGETYSRCVAIGLQPKEIAGHMEDLASFIPESGNPELIRRTEEYDRCSVPRLPQIKKLLEQFKQELGKCEQRLTILHKEIESAETEKSSVTQEIRGLLEERNMRVQELDEYSRFKAELQRHGHSDKGTALLLKAMDWTKNKGFDFIKIVDQFSDYQELKSRFRRLQVEVATRERDLDQLQERANFNEQMIKSHSQLYSQMNLLKEMGFDYNQLKQLYYVITEIAEALGFSQANTVKKFFDDIERNYHRTLGFDKRIEEQKKEVNGLAFQRLCQVNMIASHPYVGDAIARLLRRGMSEDQIVKVSSMLEMHPELVESFTKNNPEQEINTCSGLSPVSTPSPSSSLAPQSPASSSLLSESSPSSSSSSPSPPASAPEISSMDNSASMSNIKFNSNFRKTQSPCSSLLGPHDDNLVISPLRNDTKLRDQILQNEEIKSASVRDHRTDKANSQIQSQTPLFSDNTSFIFASSFQIGERVFQFPDALQDQIFKFPPASEPESTRNNKLNNSIQQRNGNQRQASSRNTTSSPPDYTLINTLHVASITASGSDSGNRPENVLDGNPYTVWSNKGTYSWILLDLGSCIEIHRIEIAWYSGSWFDYYYGISISKDGTEFRDVKIGSSGGVSDSPLLYELQAVTSARYVKITVGGNNLNDMSAISQVKVMGYSEH